MFHTKTCSVVTTKSETSEAAADMTTNCVITELVASRTMFSTLIDIYTNNLFIDHFILITTESLTNAGSAVTAQPVSIVTCTVVRTVRIVTMLVTNVRVATTFIMVYIILY